MHLPRGEKLICPRCGPKSVRLIPEYNLNKKGSKNAKNGLKYHYNVKLTTWSLEQDSKLIQIQFQTQTPA